MQSNTQDPNVATQLLSRLLGAHGQGANDDPLLSRQDAAAYLGLSPRTLAIWASTGRYDLEVIKIGRLAKYRRSTLDHFINARAK